MLGDDLRPRRLRLAWVTRWSTRPTSDAIVKRGCVFHKAYCMGATVPAVCLPSRTMLLTGRSLFHATHAASGADPKSFTLPRVMEDAGYATLHAGKHGNSPSRITAEFDKTCDPGHAANVANTVVEFILRNEPDTPLFVYMAGAEPHDPQYAPVDYYMRYKPDTLPLPHAFAPYQPFDNGEMTIRDEMTLPFPRSAECIRGKLARYYASIAYLDAEFGRRGPSIERDRPIREHHLRPGRGQRLIPG